MGAGRALIDNPVVLFDGVCNLCNSSVVFIIKRDAKSKLKFASLQSEYGAMQMRKFNLPTSALNSVLLIKNGRLHQKSNAALEIASMLDGLWPLLYVFIIIPRFFRDFAYDWIAHNRYRWFGKKEACMIPTPDQRARFIN
jgi:predicted DCC family thiol-disulfide oxidoreductase YuxK